MLVENDVVSIWLSGRITINRYAMKKVDPRIPDIGSIALPSHGDGAGGQTLLIGIRE